MNRYSRRLWAVRNSRLLERLYAIFETALVRLHPLMRRAGYQRLEAPVAAVESWTKGLMFDCRMCGSCVLSSTGMSCPMNCPKQMRNGPCGGVRTNGNCEVIPEMPCVWMKAYEGSTRMQGGERLSELRPPVDHRLKGKSSWLRVAAEAADHPEVQN